MQSDKIMKNSIEIVGWVGAALIAGTCYFNINEKLKSNSGIYIISNLQGGTFYHKYFHSPCITINDCKYYLGNYCHRSHP
jgi:hypothetical protein